MAGRGMEGASAMGGVIGETTVGATPASGDVTLASKDANLWVYSRGLEKVHQNTGVLRHPFPQGELPQLCQVWGCCRCSRQSCRTETPESNPHNPLVRVTHQALAGVPRVLALVQVDRCWPGLRMLQQRCWAQKLS